MAWVRHGSPVSRPVEEGVGRTVFASRYLEGMEVVDNLIFRNAELVRDGGEGLRLNRKIPLKLIQQTPLQRAQLRGTARCRLCIRDAALCRRLQA